MVPGPIKGYSKLNREQQIHHIVTQSYLSEKEVKSLLSDYISMDEISQLSENVVSSYSLPYSVVPNFLINKRDTLVPMVTEESSVVAAAAKAAKFWFMRGGFFSKVISTLKAGTIYLRTTKDLDHYTDKLKSASSEYINNITTPMKNRGGGLLDVELQSLNGLDNVYKLKYKFDTVDSMGANFINTTLEKTKEHLSGLFSDIEFLIAILSNHSPECIVESEVSCDISDLTYVKDVSPAEFSRRFQLLVDIANVDLDRAATHNKGIMNGVDSVLISTGNDFRAVESSLGSYLRDNGLLTPSTIIFDESQFKYSLKMPLALGTVGGITDYHSKAKISKQILRQPTSSQLMEVVCSVGLASNFAAIAALITTGIQQGHMKLHNKKWDSYN